MNPPMTVDELIGLWQKRIVHPHGSRPYNKCCMAFEDALIGLDEKYLPELAQRLKALDDKLVGTRSESKMFCSNPLNPGSRKDLSTYMDELQCSVMATHLHPEGKKAGSRKKRKQT